jgi:hypothetical protein
MPVRCKKQTTKKENEMTALIDNYGLLVALLMLVGLAGVIIAISLKTVETKQDDTLEKLDRLMSELASTETYIEYLKARETIV